MNERWSTDVVPNSTRRWRPETGSLSASTAFGGAGGRLGLAAIVVGCLTSVLVASAAAGAQDVPDTVRRARAHFASGATYFETGNWSDAAREFRAAYSEEPRYELLYNIYLCEERLGHVAAAEDALAAYVARLPEDAENVDVVVARLGALRRRLSSEAPAALDEEPSDAHLDAATEPGEEAGSAALVGGRDGSAPGTSGGGSGALVLAISGFALAGLGGLGLVVAGSLALERDAWLGASCSPRCDPAQLEELSALTLGADVSLGLGAAGLLAGVVGAVIAATEDPGEPSASVGAVLTRDAALLLVGGRF